VPEITASLLYDRATTIGTRSQTITDGRTEEQLCTGVSFYVLMDIGTYTVDETITDWVVAAYYDEIDALVVRKLSVTSEYEVITENLNPGASGCDAVPLLIAHSTSTQTITYSFETAGGDPIEQTATFSLEADYTAIAPYGQEIRVGTDNGQGDWSAEMDGISVSGTFGATLSNSGFGVKIGASTFGEIILKQGEDNCCPSDGCVAATTNDLDIDDEKVNTFRIYGNRWLVGQFTGMTLYGDYAYMGSRYPRLLVAEKVVTPEGAYDPQATWAYPEEQISVRLAWDAENREIGRSTTTTIFYV
jgi:hypothetical protein